MPTPSASTRLLIDFLNTIDLETQTDLLDDPAAFRRWARSAGYRPGDLRAARRVRDALRDAALREPARLPATALPVALRDGQPALVPHTIAEAALAAAVALAVTGNWSRVKLCPGEDCLEAFYDTSRNHSRIWCDMAACGNLTKVRAYRARPRG